MIKLWVFDMGGVLVRDIECLPRILAFLGCGEEELRRPGFQRAQHEYGLGLIGEGELWRRYEELTGRKVPPYGESLLGKYFFPRLDEPTAELLLKLKARGGPVVCGTNTGDAHYQAHLRLGQYAVFDRVYASQLMHLAKPDPAFYRHILNAEGVPPEETFFTDDFPKNVEAARALGIAAFTYTGAEALREQLASLGIPL
jgi:putative hydrolase of the HAD superfamily